MVVPIGPLYVQDDVTVRIFLLPDQDLPLGVAGTVGRGGKTIKYNGVKGKCISFVTVPAYAPAMRCALSTLKVRCSPLSSYALAMRCPVLAYCMVLRACYGMSGTDMAQAILLRACYVMSGTDYLLAKDQIDEAYKDRRHHRFSDEYSILLGLTDCTYAEAIRLDGLQ
eukprot:826669-Rhodomonas_salina.3